MKLPSEAIEKDYFYCRPISYHSDDDALWYSAVPLGKNTLSVMVSKMCTEAGVSGNKTNYSLRVSGATSLFSAGVPERIIQQRTGHRSVEALQLYERVTDQQNVSVSRILSGEVDQFDTSTLSAKKNGPDDDELPETQKTQSQPGESSICYNNCSFNIYQSWDPFQVPPQYPVMPPHPIMPSCPAIPPCPTMSSCPAIPPCPTMSSCPAIPPRPTMPSCPAIPPRPTMPSCPAIPPRPTMSSCPSGSGTSYSSTSHP